MRAAILSIGSELLHGFLTDTNATFLAQELNAAGIEVVRVSQVGDDLQRIVTAFRQALNDADVVVASGGIGPTDDDLTREAVAEIAGETVSVDEAAADTIRQFFALRGVPMPEQNIKQAWLIPSAESLLNPMGTAPGWFVRLGDQRIVIMPGVPREMYRMWREQALPRLLESLGSDAIVSRTLKTIGIGESAVEQQILAIIRRGYPIVATYAKDDGVHIRITAIADDREVAERNVHSAESEVRQMLDEHIYGYLDDALASVILRPVIGSGQRLAVYEAGNAGRFSSLLAEVPEADIGLWPPRTISYHDASSESDSIEPLAVAERGAARMARESGSGFACGLAVAIVAGETPDRAKGRIGVTMITPDGSFTRRHEVTAVPHEIRRRATMWASDFLWSTLRRYVNQPE